MSNQSDLGSEEEIYKEALAFFNIQEQHATSAISNQSSRNGESDNASSHRTLEDYLKPLRSYQKVGKNHPLIEDGFLIEVPTIMKNKYRKYSLIEHSYAQTCYQCVQCKKTFKDFNRAIRHSADHLSVKFKQ